MPTSITILASLRKPKEKFYGLIGLFGIPLITPACQQRVKRNSSKCFVLDGYNGMHRTLRNEDLRQ